MTLTRKDALATLLTGLAALAFAATHQSWDVWLIGSSHRWAAVVIVLLGAAACALGSADGELSKGKDADAATKLLAAVGTVAAVLAVLAIATGSLTALSLLVACVAILWTGATLRHAWHPRRGPVPAH